MAAIEPGILRLREERMARRRALFDDFAAYWADLGRSGSWDGLGDAIGGGKPVTIALIGDVHANLPALEAVLRDARERGAIAVLDAGDAVGYGPFPEETVAYLREQGVLSGGRQLRPPCVRRRRRRKDNFPRARESTPPRKGYSRFLH